MPLANITLLQPFNIDSFASFDFGNISVGNLKTDNLLYANGVAMTFATTAQGAAADTAVQPGDLATVATSGSYTDLINKPSLFDGEYTSLANKPALFDGSYANLTGKPTLFDGEYASLANTPALFSGSYTDLSNKPTLGTAAATDATAYATAAQGATADTALQPSDLTGYATESYVGNAVANLVASAPAALDTLNELAIALGNDASFSTSITNSLANKLSTSDFTSTADTWLGTKSTSNVTEGTNLYYTVARANTAIDARVTKSFVEALGANANVANTALSVAGSNVTGQVANALVAGTVYTAAQPNITSVGTLTELTVGNVTANVHIDNGNISALNISSHTGYFEGNLTVLGNLNAEVGGILYANSSIIYGNVDTGEGAIYVGVPGYTALPNTIAQFGANINNYAQLNFENTSDGNVASTDIVVTPDNGTDTDYYLDMGVAGSGWDGTQENSLGDAVHADDGYLYMQGNTTSGNIGNLVVGTSAANTALKFIAGGTGNGNVRAIVDSTGLSVIGNITAQNTNFTGSNVSLGNVANIKIGGGSTGYILQTDGAGNLEWVDNLPSTLVFNANSISLTDGVYVSGNVTSIQSFGDYATGNVYVLTDGTGTAPAWYADIDFVAVSSFNRVVLNINYTAASGHTIYVQLYNNSTSLWDSIGTYTGLGTYYAFALQVIDSAPYISSGVAQLRLYHSNSGNASHTTSIDYVALELSSQGPQGPRGLTGATGNTGAGVVTGGTTGQVLTKNSGTNYDTAWASEVSFAAVANSVAVANVTGIGNIATINLDGDSSTILYGNGVFAAAPTGGAGGGESTVTSVDTFNGDGTETVFTLSVAPQSINQTFINYNGALQLRSAYTLSGQEITFSEAPANGSVIEVTTQMNVTTGSGNLTVRNYTGTGSQADFSVSSGVNATNILVTENGLVQTPTTDYTVSGSTLTFTTAPGNGIKIQVRELGIAVATITPVGSNTQVLFNDAGAFGNSSGFTFSKSSNKLTVANLAVSSYIAGNLIPSANVTYDLGTATNRWKDLYLSGSTIDLAGAKIKSDPTTGAIAFVPPTTVSNPNPTALVISSTGGISTAETTNGVITSNAIGVAAAVNTLVSPRYITMYKTGEVITSVGTSRYYPPSNVNITSVSASLSGSSSTDLSFAIYKNGSNTGAYTITANSFIAQKTDSNITLTTTDYLTVNILSGSGTDLKLDLQYTPAT